LAGRLCTSKSLVAYLYLFTFLASLGWPFIKRQFLTSESQFHKRFVDKHGWIDEPLFQELFAVTQALSGPASTKMLYCINLRRNGFLGAVLAFLIWS
jgi:hypothetical protein